MQEYLRRLLEDKARLKKWKKIMIALSCVVVVCTVYALSLPAQTLACDKEEHTHTAECYDENNELICDKEEHTHTDDCTKQEEVNEANEAKEQEESTVVKDGPETFADVCIHVPETETYKIQELHLPVYHCLCLMLEEKFFGN